MVLSSEQLELICRIGRDSSNRGAGRALRASLAASEYRRLRSALDVDILVEYLRAHPEVVVEWLMYSDDKRTPGGSYFLERRGLWSVGQLDANERTYPSAAEACAHFILEELDFWSAVSRE